MVNGDDGKTNNDNPATNNSNAAADPVMQQILAQLAKIEQFMSKQETVNSKQEERVNSLERTPLPLVSIDEQRPLTVEQQLTAMRKVRQTVHGLNSGTILSSPATFAPPVVRPMSDDERARRQSYGQVGLVTPTPLTPNDTTTNTTSPTAQPTATSTTIDRGRNSPYALASHALSKIDRFYGDGKNDKVDVIAFLDSVEFHMSRYMHAQSYGRLELVTSCTAGPAFRWLRLKTADLNTAVAAGQFTPEMAEWNEALKTLFIEAMGGKQAEMMAKMKLSALTYDKEKGIEEVAKFVSKFKEYALTAYPLHRHPDTEARSLTLADIFKERVRVSDYYVWKEAMRMVPRPYPTLENWEEALSEAWGLEYETSNGRKQGRFKGNGSAASGTGGYQSTGSSSGARLNHMSEEKESSAGAGAASESVNVANTGRGRTPNRPNNKYIDGRVANQLIRANRCLYCYQKNHRANDCKAPATRAPNSDELKD